MSSLDWVIALLGAGATTFLITAWIYVEDMISPYENN